MSVAMTECHFSVSNGRSTQPAFTCSKSVSETPERCVKFVQSQYQKHQNVVQNLFKVSNKDTRTTSLTSFWCLYC